MGYKKDFYKIAGEYCGEELVHGMPHIERMLKNFRKLKADETNQKILDALELAVILHDIGKKFETLEKKHGLISKEILNSEKYRNAFRQIPNYEWIEYAIYGHDNAIEIERIKSLEKPEEICLALLLALDNMDAIGKIGVRSDFQNMNDKGNNLNSLSAFLDKNNSFIDGNVSRLREIQKVNVKKLLEEYKILKAEQVDYMSKLKEGNLKIEDRDIKEVLSIK